MSRPDNRPPFDDSVNPRTLSQRNVSAVADYIRSGHVSKIVFMVGAGISTSAGIPDFRSPDTGLYANLAHLGLPNPEAVFDIGYFRKNPLPFFTLAKDMYPGEIRPTVAHSFMKLLSDKGLVLHIFTQNIDCLERAAGIPSHLITEAHGSFATHSCTKCRATYPDDLMRENVQKLAIPRCKCGGIAKPDIVFFGESLPAQFFQKMPTVAEADLVIIMGTSLLVMPFAVLPMRVRGETPRVLINREVVGGIGSRRDDVVMLDSCDAGVRRLAKNLGWLDELEELWAKTDPDIKTDKGKRKQDVYDGPMDMDEVLRAQVASLTRDVDKSLNLAEKHRSTVSHQLRISNETRNALPTEQGFLQQVERESHASPTIPANKPGCKTVTAPVPTAEAPPTVPAVTSTTQTIGKTDDATEGQSKSAEAEVLRYK